MAGTFCDLIPAADSPKGYYILALHGPPRPDCEMCSTNMGWFAVQKTTGRVFEWNVADDKLGQPVRVTRAKGQTDVPDEWRYVPATSDQGAAAEFGEMGAYGFRLRCVRTRHELFFEYFPGDGGPGDWTEEARNSGIVLILNYPASDTQTSFTVHGPVTRNSLTGTMALTADLADQIAETPQILLYGENGPSNMTFGGAAAAVRRVVKECAPARTGPRLPKVERGS